MPFIIAMPKLSPTMEEGEIASWVKKVGDHVKEGEVLLEVTTDKATVEYYAPQEGYLRKILVLEGQKAKINDPIAIFSKDKEEPIEEPEKKEKPEEEKVIVKEEKKIEERKVEIAPQVVFEIPPPLEKYVFPPREDISERILASPLARKLAKEKGLDLSGIRGTGPDGRILSRDLDLAQPDRIVGFGKREKPKFKAGDYEEVEPTPMQRAVGKRLQAAKTFIPHFYATQRVKVDTLVDLREGLKEAGISVTYNDFLIRACALALREHPNINAGYNAQTDKIVYFKTVDIAVAVSVEGGLITPIVRYADYKNLGEISKEVKHLVSKVKEGKLALEEYQGGSFTVSNLGMYGITSFLSILNPPQAAILAIGAIEEVATVREGKVTPGKEMMISLSADHRVIDGAEASKFVKTIQKYLENSVLLIVN